MIAGTAGADQRLTDSRLGGEVILGPGRSILGRESAYVRAVFRLGRGRDHRHAAIADATLGDITIGEVAARLRLIPRAVTSMHYRRREGCGANAERPSNAAGPSYSLLNGGS
jgi:hypothetical protein